MTFVNQCQCLKCYLRDIFLWEKISVEVMNYRGGEVPSRGVRFPTQTKITDAEPGGADTGSSRREEIGMGCLRSAPGLTSPAGLKKGRLSSGKAGGHQVEKS
jgi:hypothetical protein